ncbi:MAG: glycine/betaine ABC transporter ATP-binding protein, partial [Chloroflexota bacterium]
GRVVQQGRPEEVVGAPADDYVADFVQEVPKSRVLTLRWIARPATPQDDLTGPQFPSTAVIHSVVHAAVASERPIRVVDDGQLVGLVDRVQILNAIAGAEGEGGVA